MSQTVISIRNLRKVYRAREGEVEALRAVSFDIRAGEFVSLVGPSGCGKSTLLKILAGLIGASGGEVEIAGTPVRGPRRDVGIVFQQPVLLPWRTVLANVMLPAQVQGLDRTAHERKAHELLSLVGLTGFEHRYPNELSGGMQQRVAITRALIHSPAILIMDEPFGALDAMTREHMNLELQRIWLERRPTVLFITHSIPEAVFLGDRVLVMTPRPGYVADVVDVDLPRPRSLDVMATERFGALVARIRERFQVKGAIA